METLQQLVEKIESCAFECEAGPLIMCIDWLKLKAKIEESAPAQSSTATVQCISGGDTLTEREVPIVGQGEIAQGAAPLEPVAYIDEQENLTYAHGLSKVDKNVAVKFGGWIPLHAIPPGYAVVPVEQCTDPHGTDSESWSKNPNHWANKEAT